jgi:hypothetical protein
MKIEIEKQDERIYFCPIDGGSEEELYLAIKRDTPIVIANYCVCDLNETKLRELLIKSKTRFVGLANFCNSKDFVENCNKTWIDIPFGGNIYEGYAILSGATKKQYRELERKKIEIGRIIERAINIGMERFCEGLLERLE